MGAFESCGGARLAHEPRHSLDVARRFGQHQLDRDALLQVDVLGGQHDAHSTLTEHPLDLVLACQNLAFHPARLVHARTATPKV